MNKKILILIITQAFFTVSFSDPKDLQETGQAIIDAKKAVVDDIDVEALEGRKKSGTVDNKHEYGILSGTYLVYTKIRNTVRTTYDEIQYWKGIGTSFKAIGKWYEDQKNNLENIRDISVSLFTDPGTVYSKLAKSVQLFNTIDYVVFDQDKRLNHIIMGIEQNYLNNSLLMPPTEQVCFGVKILGSLANGKTLSNEEYAKFYDESLDNLKIRLQKKGITKKEKNEIKILAEDVVKFVADTTLKSIDLEPYSEYTTTKLSREITGICLAEAQSYYNWSQKAIGVYDSIISKTDSITNLNEVMLLSDWFALEEYNANIKLIQNQHNEIKMYTNLLGLKIRQQTKTIASSHYRSENYDLMNLYLDQQLKKIIEDKELRKNQEIQEMIDWKAGFKKNNQQQNKE